MTVPKILIFAHKPPPHHGQSQMVQFLVDGLADGSRGVQIYHVDAQLSSGTEDIGRARFGKVFALFGYVAQAWSARLTGKAQFFYYVPSPAKRVALYRDWIVMALCRWCFSKLILHWHAVGLGTWLSTGARPWEKRLTLWLLGGADLSISLSQMTQDDAKILGPLRSVTVPNGIIDPVSDYETRVAPRRLRRHIEVQSSRQQPDGAPLQVQVLYLALCSRDKGVIDALNSVIEANHLLEEQKAGFRLRLIVAGEFVREEDRREFEAINSKHGTAELRGFLKGPEKAAIFEKSDVFLFPTYYANEGQPLNLVEAMAWGLPIVTTRWRAIPEILPTGYPGIVEPRNVNAIAAALLRVVEQHVSPELRLRFLSRFSINRHLESMTSAFKTMVS